MVGHKVCWYHRMGYSSGTVNVKENIPAFPHFIGLMKKISTLCKRWLSGKFGRICN